MSYMVKLKGVMEKLSRAWKHGLLLKFLAQFTEHTERDVADVVSHGGISVLKLQGGLSVIEEHLRGRVAGTAAFLKLLRRHKQTS